MLVDTMNLHKNRIIVVQFLIYFGFASIILMGRLIFLQLIHGCIQSPTGQAQQYTTNFTSP